MSSFHLQNTLHLLKKFFFFFLGAKLMLYTVTLLHHWFCIVLDVMCTDDLTHYNERYHNCK